MVNYWAYAIIKDGKKIRARMGDNGTTLDYGEPLEEELELLSTATIDNYGQKKYFFGNDPGVPYSEYQVGENFVFEIYKRFTGESLDSSEGSIHDAILSGYQIIRSKKITHSVTQPQSITAKQIKPWWKFW